MTINDEPDWITRTGFLFVKHFFVSMKLRSNLIILVVAALVPLLIFAGALFVMFNNQQRAAQEQSLVERTYALSLDVDREVSASVRALQALATSKYLDTGDLKQFHDQATRALKAHGGWEAIVLMDTSEQHLINTRLPFGSPLPRGGITETVKKILQTGRPAVSDLFLGPTAKKPLLVVAVPVMLDGSVKYILTASTSPAFLTDILSQQKLPDGWLATIVDGNKTIIARTQNLDKFLGQPATPLFAAKSREAVSGLFYGVTRDEIPVVTGYHRSELTGWTVGVAIPLSLLEATLKRSLITLAAGGFLLLAMGVAIAFFFGSRIARPITALSTAAVALGNGETPEIPPIRIIELDRVAREIESAAVNRNQMEAALRHSEERLKTIIETEPECVKIVAPDGRLVEMNPAGLAMLEAATLEEVKARTLLEFIAPEYRTAFGDLHKRVMEGESGTLEFEIVGLKGTRRWLETHAVPLRDEEGKPSALLGITRDITQRKLAEEKARNNLERLRALHEIDLAITSTLDLRTVLDVLLEKIDRCFPYRVISLIRLLNPEGRVEPVAARNLEIDRLRVGSGAGLARRVLESKVPLAVRNLQTDPRVRTPQAFRDRGLVSYVGVPLIVKDKVLGLFSLYTKEERDFGEEQLEFLTTLANQAAIAIHNAQLYEQSKKHVAELEKLNKVKDEFLSVMSHELRTPLSVVTGYAGMIKDRLLGEINLQQEQALEKMLTRAADQLAMINDILQTAQIDAHVVAMELQAVDLNDFFTQLKSDYDVRTHKKNVRLIWDYPADAAPIHTDLAKLQQVLQNLINNALKFTAEGTITISARVPGDGDQRSGVGADSRPPTPGPSFVEFKVSDTGIGIPAQMHEQIFKKFHQVDSSETRIYDGVGLGLYIVRQFTDMLGGKVEVESEPGKGSTFTVRLPL